MEQEIRTSFIDHLLLQQELNSIIDPNWYKNLTLQDFSRAIRAELYEAIDSIPWQWWKKTEFDFYNFKIELIDTYHFILSAIILESNIFKNKNVLDSLQMLLDQSIDEEIVDYKFFEELYDIKIEFLKNILMIIENNFIKADKIKLFMYDDNSFIKHTYDNLLFNDTSDISYKKILEYIDEIVCEAKYTAEHCPCYSIIDRFIKICATVMTFYEFDLLYRIKNKINQLRQEKQYKETLKARLLNGKDDNEFIIDIVYREQKIKSYQDFEIIIQNIN